MNRYGDDRNETLCPECGAPTVDGLNCWEQLGALGIWEFEYAELLAEHFKTMAAYNLQHPAQFTEETLQELKAVFIEHVDNGLSVSEVRKRMEGITGANGAMLKDEADRHPVRRQWDMTIADVYIPDHPEGTAERVRAWAAAVRKAL